MLNDGKCHCDMRTKMVGDGCSVCNPEYAADHMGDDEDDMLTDERICEIFQETGHDYERFARAIEAEVMSAQERRYEAMDEQRNRDHERIKLLQEDVTVRIQLAEQQAERIAELERKTASYKLLTESQEKHISYLHLNCRELEEARKTLDSEREMNERLSVELFEAERKNSEIAAAQRERCARIVDAPHWKAAVRHELKARAAAIRALGDE